MYVTIDLRLPSCQIADANCTQAGGSTVRLHAVPPPYSPGDRRPRDISFGAELTLRKTTEVVHGVVRQHRLDCGDRDPHSHHVPNIPCLDLCGELRLGIYFSSSLMGKTHPIGCLFRCSTAEARRGPAARTQEG